MSTIHLEVVTPDAKVISIDTDYVGIPGVEGEFGVLPGHIPFISALAVGSLYYKSEGKNTYVFVSGGFTEISENHVSVLAESAEKIGDIDINRAKAAKLRAEERLKDYEKGNADIDTTRAEAALCRAVARISIAEHNF